MMIVTPLSPQKESKEFTEPMETYITHTTKLLHMSLHGEGSIPRHTVHTRSESQELR